MSGRVWDEESKKWDYIDHTTERSLGDKLRDNVGTIGDKLGTIAKTSGKMAYNSTIGELSNVRVPILSTVYRTIIRKPLTGKHVFSEKKYIPLGGLRYRRKNNRTKRSK